MAVGLQSRNYFSYFDPDSDAATLISTVVGTGEGAMTRTLTLGILIVAALTAFAKEPVFHQQGNITNMDAVECGVDENSGKSFAGEVLGTDSGHKKTRELLCQEYVLKTDRIM